MSTNKTPNLNLHSWVPDDPFRRVEFNDNFAALDANAGQTWDAIGTKADAAAVAAIQRTLDSVPRIAYGSYEGDGETSHSLSFGFTPRFIAVVSVSDTFHCFNVLHGTYGKWLSMGYDGNNVGKVYASNYTLENNVLTVTANTALNAMNLKNYTYHYVAFG